MPYVNQRWLGGMLTNFVTIRKRLGLLDASSRPGRPTASSTGSPRRKRCKLDRRDRAAAAHLGGIRNMRRLPDALFVVDPQREHIAVTEARKLEIPVIGTGRHQRATRTSSTTSSPPTTTPSAPSGCCARSSPTRPSRAPRARSSRRTEVPEEAAEERARRRRRGERRAAGAASPPARRCLRTDAETTRTPCSRSSGRRDRRPPARRVERAAANERGRGRRAGRRSPLSTTSATHRATLTDQAVT